MLTLLDFEVSFHVVCQDHALLEEITRYLELNTISQSRDLQQADFILCLEPSLNGRFPELKKGSLTQPHEGATVFYLMDSLARLPQVNSRGISLTGPGVQDVQNVYVSGLDSGELAHWCRHRNDYPLGIDMYLVSRSGKIIGIPRSVRIKKSGDR
jgi:alpha-D-ribose 1-methylphosphonate 5-triphosphate synthase subunit PhnH